MSSRGPIVSGSDGTDFGARQRILAHYQVSALTKKRLHFTLIIHLMLSAIMFVKLIPTILDMFDIFWQDLEELLIPMAEPWEWAWFSTIAFVFVAMNAIKSNNTRNVLVFAVGIVLFGIVPLLWCATMWFSDLKTFINTRDASRTSATWRDYPLAIYWYAFLTVTMQVHIVELYLSYELHKALGSGSRSAAAKRKRN